MVRLNFGMLVWVLIISVHVTVKEISWTGDDEFSTPIDTGNTGKIRGVVTPLSSGTTSAVAYVHIAET
jgi:hypothetical protein